MIRFEFLKVYRQCGEWTGEKQAWMKCPAGIYCSLGRDYGGRTDLEVDIFTTYLWDKSGKSCWWIGLRVKESNVSGMILKFLTWVTDWKVVPFLSWETLDEEVWEWGWSIQEFSIGHVQKRYWVRGWIYGFGAQRKGIEETIKLLVCKNMIHQIPHLNKLLNTR